MNEPKAGPGGWIRVARSEEVAQEGAREVILGDQIVALFRHQDTLYALDGMCAHQGGPLAEGQIAHGCITCPWHGWQYELKTGIQTINHQPLQQVFEVRERDGEIEIKLP